MANQNIVAGCIYCGTTGNFSEEHYLPMCVGNFRGYECLCETICKSCNAKFSKLDEQFCRTSTAGVFRKLYEIEGRRKGIWDPFKKGFGYAPPVEIFDVNGIRYEPSGRGDGTVRDMRQLVIYCSSGEPSIIVIPDWAMQGIDQMKRFLKDKLKDVDFSDVESVALHADEKERDISLRAMEELKLFRYERTEWTEPAGGDVMDVSFGSFITDKYMRAVAKIGFHYFLKYFPSYNGAGPRFEGIREFIETGGNIRSGRDIDRFVRLSFTPLSFSQIRGHLPGWNGHILAASVDHYGFRAWAQFFLIAKRRFTTPTYEIFIGSNPFKLLFPRPVTVAHRYEYFPGGKQGQYDGEVIEAQEVSIILP